MSDLKYDPAISIFAMNRVYTLMALTYFKGNKTNACRALGITTKTLYNWLRDWDVDLNFGLEPEMYHAEVCVWQK